jgi:23S rRNA C2498 (ribose-2'-O)-methylase RlmM
VGQLDPASPGRYYKTLASNLRGRALQIFPPEIAAAGEAEAQDPELPTLFCLVGEKGLFAGMRSPRLAGGFYPGGTKFIAQSGPETVSRAGAKVAGSLHRLLLERPPLAAGSHWLELGASPGGMTSELLDRGFRVTAIDRAPLDKRLDGRPGLTFARMDVAGFRPNAGMRYDAMLCDMNGPAAVAAAEMARLGGNLKPGGIAVFTLKMAGADTYAEMAALVERTVEIVGNADLRVISACHLAYNRREVTMFFERRAEKAKFSVS